MNINIGNNVNFNCDEYGGIDGFCAMIVYNDFMVFEAGAYSASGVIAARGGSTDIRIKDKKLLFKTICKYHANRFPDRSMFFGDAAGGHASELIFPYVPEQPFTMTVCKKKFRFTPQLSKKYRNHNTGNMVQHLTVICERISSK